MIPAERLQKIPVTFIIPPSTFLADERVFPVLGPLKVAACLRQNDIPVEVLDLSGFENYEGIVRQYVRSTHTRIFGLTATTPQIPAAVRVLDVIKGELPDARVILGGPHVTLTHAGMLQDVKMSREGRGTTAFRQLTRMFDKLVVGDGEQAIFPAINPQNYEPVIDAGSLESPFFIKKGTLDHYPFPARDLIAMESYHYDIDGHRAFSMIAQLGCPFECGFCGGRDSQVFRMARARSVENVIHEMETVVRQSMIDNNPYSAAMFYDDELNIVPKGLEKLCEELIQMQKRLGFEMRFRGFIKAELFTPQQAELMYKAGFRNLLSGVESGDAEMLETMRKHTTPEINARCVKFAHEAGLQFKALMSIGHPGESNRSIENSVGWVLSNLRAGDDVDWTIITEYPGSPYYDRSVYIPGENAWLYTEPKTGNRLWSREMDYAIDAYYYKGIPGEYDVYVWTDHLTEKQLASLRDQAELTTRSALGLPPITAVTPRTFEHSMGQHLPSDVLKKS